MAGREENPPRPAISMLPSGAFRWRPFAVLRDRPRGTRSSGVDQPRTRVTDPSFAARSNWRTAERLGVAPAYPVPDGTLPTRVLATGGPAPLPFDA